MAKKADGELKIEKGVPIPRRTNRGGVRNDSVRAAVRKLAVGESVLTAKKAAASKAIYEVAAITGALFISRTVEGGTRVWRIK